MMVLSAAALLAVCALLAYLVHRAVRRQTPGLDRARTIAERVAAAQRYSPRHAADRRSP